MSTDLFDRYASLDPANSPQAAPDWASMAPVLLAAIDERTIHMQTQEAPVATPTHKSSRNGLLIAAAVFAIVVIAGAALAFIATRGEPQPAAPFPAPIPEEVVAQFIEAFNARDTEAVAALYGLENTYVYDASAAGAAWANREASGREDVLALLDDVWGEYSPTVISYMLRSINGGTVTTAETVEMAGGATYGHIVTYEISDDGLIVLEDHFVRAQ